MLLGGLLLLLGFGSLACRKPPEASRAEASAAPAGAHSIPAGVPYEIAVVQKNRFPVWVSTTGVTALDPARQVVLTAPQRSLLQSIATLGERVSKDAVVAVLEPLASPGLRVEVRSPIAGLVLRPSARVGEIVEEGGRLLEVADDSVMWVWVRIYPVDLDRVRPGTPAVISVPGTSQTLSGVLDLILPEVGPDRVVQGRVVLQDRPGVPAGLVVDVRLTVGHREGWAVPKEAVVFDGTRALVARVHLGSDGSVEGVEAVEVSLGFETDRLWEVTGDLQAGDRVISKNAFLVLKARHEAVEAADE
ncbi:MAG: efflux RND transporter periplasmic adaptor subunit [Acidobacteria bacterium]|nr:efflux RND transporter periplasmic adaptor subunit [Acidobacteriota bacterium]MDW7985197.1 efflux RND transporter periplasmic adaptor subunit [Acidobacteriota bacterium]